MDDNSEYLEESCWEDGECSNECEQCNNITGRCCVSCDGRIGCQYLCHIAKLQQEHERKSDDELIELFSDWAEEDGRFLYAEDRVRLLSGKLAVANERVDQAEARNAVLLNSYCGECDFDPEICRGTEPEIECAARLVMDGTPEAILLDRMHRMENALREIRDRCELRIQADDAHFENYYEAKDALEEVPPCSG